MSDRQTVLIVDDDEDLRRLFRTALSLAGFDVAEAGDGLEALQRIDHTPPDLIVLDLMLPGLSGVVVHEEVTGHAATRRIPVVVVTGSTRDASEFDVACFLRKPVAPDKLVETVRSCLASHGR